MFSGAELSDTELSAARPSVEQPAAWRGAVCRPEPKAATVVRREDAQHGWNRGEDEDAGLMGQEGKRERGRPAGYLSGEHGDRNQESEDERGHEAQEGGKPPARGIAEQVVDAGGVDPVEPPPPGSRRSSASRGRGRIDLRRRAHRALVRTQLGQRLLAFDEVAEPG